MQVSVGYYDNPDTAAAGTQVIKKALERAGRTDPCDQVLLFSTARHDPAALREAVASVLGESIPVYGGGTTGVITNEHYGYAGDQVGAACIWLDTVRCDVLIEGGLKDGEEETGIRLGKRLAQQGTKPDSPLLLFYDAVDADNGFRLLMATPLLAGIKKGLGFPPGLSGTGMIGDNSFSPFPQWIGNGMGKSNAISLAFSGDIRMDSVIVHGCRPSSQYFTVTKADGNVILEINDEPAIPFIDKILGSTVSPEQYPFFLIFGINHGERWGEYDEDYYASRLCFGIDKRRNGIVMFEPDMKAGTEFQLMYRSLDLDYIKPRISKAFDELDGRKPVFALYIDCAGRCAGYAGIDLEDALVVQQTVAGRCPLLGLYNGVEIAPLGGRSRGLDWTGVFCLFSQSEDDGSSQAAENGVAWKSDILQKQTKEVPLKAIMKINEQNAAKIFALDVSSAAIRLELEQKRRGFTLLSELTASLQHNATQEETFASVSRRINAALNMQRTVVLKRDKEGRFSPDILQGYSLDEKAALGRRKIDVPAELFAPTIVSGADSADRFKEFRALLDLPYFVSSPIMLQGKCFAVLVTGRLSESPPFLLRLNHGDMETLQAICVFLASVLIKKRLEDAEIQNRMMVEAAPIGCLFWDEDGILIGGNQEIQKLFKCPNMEEFLKRFSFFSLKEQSKNLIVSEWNREIENAFVTGCGEFNWTCITADGERVPTEITLIRIPRGEGYIMAGYVKDLRSQDAVTRYFEAKNHFLASINHELRTPLNAIRAMGRIVSEIPHLNESQKDMIHHGMQSVELLTSTIGSILDFSAFDPEQLSLNNARFSIKDLMENLKEIICNGVKEKSLYFRVSIDSRVPEFVCGDFDRLRQVLLLIIKNAIKFTETGGVDVRVFPEHDERDSKIPLVFAVTDTGIGIREEHSGDLFKPLFVADMSYTRKHDGLGMGLAISNNLVTLMGGKITYQSRLGEGSTFNVHLSLPIPREHAVEAKYTGSCAAAVLHGMRVLVAEDNRINRMVMKELLSSAGIEAVFAENGIKVLEKLNEGVFDLILMDIQMPEMDGLTTAAQIRSDPRYADLPILAVTANAGADSQKECFQVGMNAHLTKPVNVEELYGELSKWRRS